MKLNAARIQCIVLSVSLLLVGVGCEPERVDLNATDISLASDLSLHRISDGLWLHRSWSQMPDGTRVSANGLLLISNGRGALIDVPWTDAQTAELFDWAQAGGARLQIVLPTHSHPDAMGGLAEANRRGVLTYGLGKTIDIANENGLPVPKTPFAGAIVLGCGGRKIVARHFGPGHSPDNVTVYLPDSNVLFAGCLIRPADAVNLGNTEDADLAAWPATVTALKQAYPDVQIIVPGHGEPAGPELLDHTLQLCENALSEAEK